MTAVTAVFRGTEQETRELLAAVASNCVCPKNNDIPDGSCAAQSLLHKQRTLDGLLYARNQRNRLRQQEFTPVPDGGS